MRGGENKCRILEVQLKLRDKQLKTIMFTYRLLYQILMVTADEKSIIDVHTERKRNPKKKIRKNKTKSWFFQRVNKMRTSGKAYQEEKREDANKQNNK